MGVEEQVWCCFVRADFDTGWIGDIHCSNDGSVSEFGVALRSCNNSSKLSITHNTGICEIGSLKAFHGKGLGIGENDECAS